MDAVKRKNRVGKIALCGLILILVIGLFLVDLDNAPDTFYKGLTGGGKAVVGEIVRRTSFVQEYPYHAGDCGVSIQFATYADRKNLGNVNVHIEGETSGFIYANQTEPVAYFQDGAFVDFAFADGCPDKDETLRIEITSTSRSGQAITIWGTADDALPGYSLTVGGEERDNDLVMRTIFSSGRKNMAWLVLALIVICLVISMLLIFKGNRKPERIYLLIALSLGIIYTLVMTPLSIADEHTHYHSAFRLSNVFCLQWDNIGEGAAKYNDFHDLVSHANTGSAYDRILNELLSPSPKDQTEMVPLRGALGYPPMLVPQAIGITIGRLLGANFLITFYLGRITNLLFFILCVYFAIKKTPRFKLLFFMIGIMPMALHQAASYSYDTFINGMAVLLFAYILRAIDGEGLIQRKDLLSIAIIGVLLAPAKVIYTPLLLLVLLISAKRFPNKKAHYMSIIVIALCVAAAVLFFQLRGILAVSSSGGSGLNWEGEVNYSIADILHQPGKMAMVYFNTFKIGIWGWFKESIGSIFSGRSLIIADWPITVYIVLLTLSAFSYEGERATTGMERCVYLLACFAPVFMLMFVMLIAWTSNTRSTIAGIQGRYFIPVLPLFYMSLNNRLVTIRRPIEKSIVILGVIVNIFVLQQVLFTTLSL